MRGREVSSHTPKLRAGPAEVPKAEAGGGGKSGMESVAIQQRAVEPGGQVCASTWAKTKVQGCSWQP